MELLDMGLVRGAITVLTLLTFLGICWWAYRPGNRGRFEDDGWMAFDPEEVEAHREPIAEIVREGEDR